MLPLFRAVVVWTVILAVIILPRIAQQPAPPTANVPVTQLSSFEKLSVLRQARTQHEAAAAAAQVKAWS